MKELISQIELIELFRPEILAVRAKLENTICVLRPSRRFGCAVQLYFRRICFRKWPTPHSETKLSGYGLKEDVEQTLGKLQARGYGFAIGCDWGVNRDK